MGILVQSNKQFEQMKNPDWESLSGTVPKRWLMWSGNKIRLIPPVSDTFCMLGYTQMPSLFTATAATATVDPRIPPAHNEFLKYAAAYYLLSMRGDRQYVELADKFLDEFHKRIGA
jgi:hypothetical protein